MKVVVIGAQGQLGSATTAHWRRHGHDVVGLTRRELDITDRQACCGVLEQHRASLVINCAAYNRVDDAESDPGGALAVNTWAVRSLAEAAARQGAAFVHYSTDFVFDGVETRPYSEDDLPNPQSVYGTSKLLGEWMAVVAPRHFVLRVESLFGGPRTRGSVDRMVDMLRSGEVVTAFRDRVVSPSFVEDVATATRHLFESDAPAGLYHVVNSGCGTWQDVADYLRKIVGGRADQVRGVPAASVGLRASRPAFAALSNAKLAAAGFVMPVWRDALVRHLNG